MNEDGQQERTTCIPLDRDECLGNEENARVPCAGTRRNEKRKNVKERDRGKREEEYVVEKRREERRARCMKLDFLGDACATRVKARSRYQPTTTSNDNEPPLPERRGSGQSDGRRVNASTRQRSGTTISAITSIAKPGLVAENARQGWKRADVNIPHSLCLAGCPPVFGKRRHSSSSSSSSISSLFVTSPRMLLEGADSEGEGGGSRVGILGSRVETTATDNEGWWGIQRGLKREVAWWEGEQSIPGALPGGLGVDIEGQG